MAQRTTPLGTPAAPSWSSEWLARVESLESSLNRRICGAATPNMTPCTLISDHPSGRCRYHGGVPSVGPPAQNENARIHGLYARRLQRCGQHCPLWNSCPYAGEDVLTLDPKQRPICAYERDEYAALVKHYFKDDLEPTADEYEDDDKPDENENEDSERANPPRSIWKSTAKPECPEPFLVHQLVLLTIMQTRAAAVLSLSALTDAVEVDSPGYKMKSARPGAALEAFVRIAREYRALAAMIDRKKLLPEPKPMGIGSRLMPLMLRGQAALEEAIVDLDAVDDETRKRILTTESTENSERSGTNSCEESREDLASENTENSENAEKEISVESGEELTTESTEGTETLPP